jgi:protein SCO1/2
MNSFFTGCSTVCDAQGKRLVELQNKLDSRLGSEVMLVSLSKDPQNDTPEALKTWAGRYGVKKGWSLLTGDLSELTRAFMAFTDNGPAVIEHSPIILIGNADKNIWFKLNGLISTEEILGYIEKVK